MTQGHKIRCPIHSNEADANPTLFNLFILGVIMANHRLQSIQK